MRVNLKTLNKARAIKALAGMRPEDVLKKLKSYRRECANSEFELFKFMFIYEVSELWMGMSRTSSSMVYAGFEMFLKDHKDWAVSITKYRRFKTAVTEIGESTIKKIGLDAVQQAYRATNYGPYAARLDIIQKMVELADLNNAPLTDVQARRMVRGKVPRSRRGVTDQELREENERLKTRARALLEKAELVNGAKEHILKLKKQLAAKEAEILKLVRLNAKLTKDNAKLCEELSKAKKSSAKSKKKTPNKSVGKNNRSQNTT